jgi:cbb3-type cytochrome oxidase maturation protein
MSVIVLLILFSLVVAIVFLLAFIWAVRSGQFDDTQSPAVRILFEEKSARKKDDAVKPGAGEKK